MTLFSRLSRNVSMILEVTNSPVLTMSDESFSWRENQGNLDGGCTALYVACETRDTSLRGCTLDVRCAPHAALLALTARAKGKGERSGERNARKGHCAELIFCFWLT